MKDWNDPDRLEVARVSTKGQIVIPKSLRKELKLRAGDLLKIELVTNSQLRTDGVMFTPLKPRTEK